MPRKPLSQPASDTGTKPAAKAGTKPAAKAGTKPAAKAGTNPVPSPESNTILKGTLDVLVLKALSRAAMHGFEITEWLERQAGGSLGLDDSAVYQALYRMEKRGLVEAEWGVSEKNRRARYYEPTREGLAYLEAETTRVLSYADLVRGILTDAEGAT